MTVSVLLFFAAIFNNTFSQTIVNGIILDSISQNCISDVSIYNEKTADGTSSNKDGRFSILLKKGKHNLLISYLGYQQKSINILVDTNTKQIYLGKIYLSSEQFELNEIGIIADISRERKTPVATSTIKANTIENESGDEPFPQVMKSVPGVYPTRYGGGSGDARISIRGFKQENIALLLNGIPVSSVENGLVYWNNWIGLTEATQTIQVQRGLGASKVALNSVGGTINIITKTTENIKNASIKYSITNYGNSKTTLALSSGKLNNGYVITFLGSKTTGTGYVDATYVDAWAYFLTISKDFGKNHKLVFTGLGAPEKHGQKNLKLSQIEIDKYGNKFNKDWGSYNGEINNLSENFYHKPHFSLNHYWKISDKSFLASSAYLSFGYGGGKWSESYNYAPGIFNYRNPSGQIDWNSIYNLNSQNPNQTILANGDTVSGYSQNIQTNFLANHIWYGFLSSFNHEINENLKLTAGIHTRSFKSHLFEKVTDLLGGDFYVDNFAWAVDGISGREQIKTVGDIINVDNGAFINYIGSFGQLEYNNESISAFIAGTVSNTWFQRQDNYNYIDNNYSKTVTMKGFDMKTGLNYNLNEKHNIYFNTGYFSKAPYFKFVFGNFTNVISKDLKNEKIKAIELGYGFRSKKTSVKINTYYTYCQDKNFLSNEYIQLENNTQTRAIVKGLDALHKGVELEISSNLLAGLQIGGFLSLGNWKWKNNVIAILYDENNIAVDTIEVYANGLFVGDSPQTQIGVSAKYKIFNTIDLSARWIYYDRLYADFDPASRNNKNDNQQSYKLPAYNLMDIHILYSFVSNNRPITLSMSCYNIFDKQYIVRGEDGISHNINDFRGFWSFGRNFNFSIKIGI